MAQTITATAEHAVEVGHHDPGFIRTYIFTTDHKMIAKQFLLASLFFLLVGGLLAAGVRWQLGFPGQPIPVIGGLFSDTTAPGGIILPEFYNSMVTMHATFMIFFAIMPLLVGVFGNFLIPLQIGAPDMAFPRLNMISFWISVPAGLIMLASFFVEGGAAQSGWTSYPPLAGSARYSPYWGQVFWLVGMIFLITSSLLGAVNFLVTIINMRAPGMTFMRLPLFTWMALIVSILILLCFPPFTVGLAFMMFDRTFGTHFFDAAAGAERSAST